MLNRRNGYYIYNPKMSDEYNYKLELIRLIVNKDTQTRFQYMLNAILYHEFVQFWVLDKLKWEYMFIPEKYTISEIEEYIDRYCEAYKGTLLMDYANLLYNIDLLFYYISEPYIKLWNKIKGWFKK